MKCSNLRAAAFALVSVAFAATGRADTRIWDGGGTDNKWSTATNWSDDTVPDGDDVALFDGTSTKDATIDTDITIGVVEIKAGYTGTITQAAGVTITVASEWKQDAGVFAGPDGAINIGGPFTLKGGSFAGGMGTMTVQGEFKVEEPGSFDAGSINLAIDGPFTLTSGTFSGGTASITVAGVFKQDGGTLGAGEATIQLGSHLTPAGGTFNAGTSTFKFTGSAEQVADFTNTISFADIAVDKTGGVLRFVKKGFSADVMSISPGDTVEFTSEDTTTLGRTEWYGKPDEPIVLRSIGEGNQWGLVVPSGQKVCYVDVRDSDALGGAQVTAYNSTDSGNNLNWVFAEDHEPPVIERLAPPDTVEEVRPEVRIRATDARSGVRPDSVRMQFEGQPVGISEIEPGVYRFVPDYDLDPGSYTVVFEAADCAGNAATPPLTFTFTVATPVTLAPEGQPTGYDFSSIQGALDALAALLGGADFDKTWEIRISGVFYESVVIPASLRTTPSNRLVIRSGSQAIMDGGGVESVGITEQDFTGNLDLIDIEIRNYIGYGVRITSGDGYYFENLHVHNNHNGIWAPGGSGVISDCRVEDNMYAFYSGHGIHVGASQYSTGDWTIQDCTIERNGLGLAVNDAGRVNIISNVVCQNYTCGLYVEAQDSPISITKNLVLDNGFHVAQYKWDTSISSMSWEPEIVIRNNVFARSLRNAAWFGLGATTIENNTFWSAGDMSMHIYLLEGPGEHRMINNIFSCGGSGEVFVRDDQGWGVESLDCNYNVWHGSFVFQTETTWPDAYSLDDWKTLFLQDQDSIPRNPGDPCDPLFVDPSADDFRIRPGSPCIDAADGDAAPELDIEGYARLDDPYTPDTGTGTIEYADIGAYEFLPPPVPFQLLSPFDDATNVSLPVAFDWEDSFGAETYTLTVADDAGFTNPVIEGSLTTSDYVADLWDLSVGTQYYWRVTAVNAGGGTPASNNDFSFTTTASAVMIMEPAEGESVAGSVRITAFAADTDGIDTVNFFVDGGLIGAGTLVYANTWEVTWDATAATDGPYTLTAVATDMAAQLTSSQPVNVTLDNWGDWDGDGLFNIDELTGASGFVTDPNNADTDGDTVNDKDDTDPLTADNPPTIALTTPADGAILDDGNVVFKGSVTNDDGDAVTVRVFVDGTASASDTVPAGSGSFTIRMLLNDGKYEQVRACAEEDGGLRTAQTADRTIWVDTVDPKEADGYNYWILYPVDFNDHYDRGNSDLYVWWSKAQDPWTPQANAFTSPAWFEGKAKDETTGIVSVKIDSEDGSTKPGFVEASGSSSGEVTWHAPVEFAPSASGGVVSGVQLEDGAQGPHTDSFAHTLGSTNFTTTVRAKDAAGNEGSSDEEIFWCPIILWGREPSYNCHIAIQKGDEILVGVTPDNASASWKYEPGGDLADKDGVVGNGMGTCTVAQGATSGPGASLVFNHSGVSPDFIYIYDCVRLPYESPGENLQLYFELQHDSKPIKAGSQALNPDAEAWVTVFQLNLGAMVKDAAGNETELPEEEDAPGMDNEMEPGLIIGCDMDDDDADGTPDHEDNEILFEDPEGNDVTDDVLDDLVALKIDEVKVGQNKVIKGKVTIRVYTPGADKDFGNARLFRRESDRLVACTGNQHWVYTKDLSKDPHDEGSYYLQGVSPSVQERDVAVVLDFDPSQHGTYDWQKTCRDVVWVNVYRMEWVNHEGVPLDTTSQTSEDDEEPYDREPGQPGGVGGFGGPLPDTGFSYYQDPFRFENLVFSPTGMSITCDMISNVSSTPTNVVDGTNTFTLNRVSPASSAFASSNGTLALSPLDEPFGEAGEARRFDAFVVNPVFGFKGTMTFYETDVGTAIYMTRRVLLVAHLESVPQPTTMDVELTSNIPGPGGATSTGLVTLTGVGQGRYESTDATLVLVLKRITALGGAAIDDLTAEVTSEALGIETLLVDAIESGSDSLEFRTDMLTNQAEPLGEGNAVVAITATHYVRLTKMAEPGEKASVEIRGVKASKLDGFTVGQDRFLHHGGKRASFTFLPADKRGQRIKATTKGVEVRMKPGAAVVATTESGASVVITSVGIVLFGVAEAKVTQSPDLWKHEPGNDRFLYYCEANKIVVYFRCDYGSSDELLKKLRDRVRWSVPTMEGVDRVPSKAWGIKGEDKKAARGTGIAPKAGAKPHKLDFVRISYKPVGGSRPKRHTAFGEKTLTMEIYDETRKKVLSTGSAKFRVFFNPIKLTSFPPGKKAVANWYHYWSKEASTQDAPSVCEYSKTSGETDYVRFEDKGGYVKGAIDPANNYEITLYTRAAWLFDSPPTFPATPIPAQVQAQAANWVQWTYNPKYPSDIVNIALAHERTHEASIGATGWPSRGGTTDSDRDNVPDTWERDVPGMETDSKNSFTISYTDGSGTQRTYVGFHSRYSGGSPAPRDNEFFSWMGGAYMLNVGAFKRNPPSSYGKGQGVKPVATNREHDWALDGYNWCKK